MRQKTTPFECDSIGEDIAVRDATPNEQTYLKYCLAKRTSENPIRFVATVIALSLSVISVLGTAMSGINELLYLLPFSGIFFWLSTRTKKISLIDYLDPTEIIAEFKGTYRVKTIGEGKDAQLLSFIDDLSISMPRRWEQHIESGDNVNAELCLLPMVTDVKSLISVHPVAELVSLNNRFSIEKELTQEKPSLKSNYSFALALTTGTVSAIMTFVLAVNSELPTTKLLANMAANIVYSQRPTISYPNVAAFEKKLPTLDAGTRVKIATTAILPSSDAHNVFLFTPGKADIEKAKSVLASPKVKRLRARESLLQSFKSSNPLQLCRQTQAWQPFDAFADNPLYVPMKKRYLVDGKRICEELDRIRATGDMRAYQKLFSELSHERGTFSWRFISSETRSIESEKKRMPRLLRERLYQLWSMELNEQKKIVTNISRREVENLSENRTSADDDISLFFSLKSIEGRLFTVKLDGKTYPYIDRTSTIESSADQLLVRIISVLLLLTTLFTVRCITNNNQIKATMTRINSLYS
ncbi:MAG: hypothetical protein JXX14_06280 [Deltaproteobacteria bacterium]|nr:hypothetical protein [Deltaproteobacteria bacterium]